MVLYLHVAHAKLIWFHPYVNNQIRGTRARFYGSDMRFLSNSKPAPDKITSLLGASAWSIRHCRWHSGAARASALWLVRQLHDAFCKRRRCDQPHPDWKLARVERPDPVSPDDGMQPEPNLVDQTAACEVVRELAAAVGDQVPRVLRLRRPR